MGGTWPGDVIGIPISGPEVTNMRVDSVSITDSGAVATVSIANPETSPQAVHLRHRSTPVTGNCGSIDTRGTTGTSLDFYPSNLTPNSRYEVQASLDEEFVNGVRSTQFATHGPPTGLRLSVGPQTRN